MGMLSIVFATDVTIQCNLVFAGDINWIDKAAKQYNPP